MSSLAANFFLTATASKTTKFRKVIIIFYYYLQMQKQKLKQFRVCTNMHLCEYNGKRTIL